MTMKKEYSFEKYPILIGRSSACDLTLPDENKYVSSNHAEITVSNQKFSLADTSANGTFINSADTPVGRGNTIVLSDGDIISMGEFSLHITITNPLELPDHSDNPFADAAHAAPSNQISDDPFSSFEENAGTDSAPFKNNDHIDRLEDIGIGPSAWDTTSTDQSNDPFADFNQSPSNSKDSLYSPDFNTPSSNNAASSKTTDDTDDDWAGWIGSIPTEEPDKAPLDQPPAGKSQSNPPVTQASDDVLNALLEGAGLNPNDFANTDRVALARHIGGILKNSTLSMMLLLRSRDEIKSAMRADVTLLAAQSNSPLQFSMSVEDALKKLLTPSASTGFSDANKAIDKGLQDIKIHQLAMLEAMRSALQIALSHFDPEELAQQSRDASPLASSLPLAREAKLWEQFQSRYNDIKRETVDDFSDLFGKELRKAYEKSVKELKEPKS